MRCQVRNNRHAYLGQSSRRRGLACQPRYSTTVRFRFMSTKSRSNPYSLITACCDPGVSFLPDSLEELDARLRVFTVGKVQFYGYPWFNYPPLIRKKKMREEAGNFLNRYISFEPSIRWNSLIRRMLNCIIRWTEEAINLFSSGIKKKSTMSLKSHFCSWNKISCTCWQQVMVMSVRRKAELAAQVQ